MTDEDPRVPAPRRLYVDALGYVWQDGHAEGFLSMARTTERNLPSPGLIEYVPRATDERQLEYRLTYRTPPSYMWPQGYDDVRIGSVNELIALRARYGGRLEVRRVGDWEAMS